MKVLFTLFILFQFATIFEDLYAQGQMGTVLLGGSINFSRTQGENEFVRIGTFVPNEFTSNSLLLAPQIGFFTNESTVTGVGLQYEHSSLKQSGFVLGNPVTASPQKSHLLLINPFYLKYFQITEKFYFTTTLNFLVGLGKIESGFDDDLNLFELRFNVSPGFTYFITNSWAINSSVGQLFYVRTQESLGNENLSFKDPNNINHNYGIDLDLTTLRIGLQFFLQKLEG